MNISKKTAGQHLHVNFDSIYELSDWIADTDQVADKLHIRNAGRSTGTAGNTMDYEAAQAIGKRGGLWPEGRANIKPVALDLSAITARDMDMPRRQHSVAGYRCNVPAMLAGSPLSMYRRPRTPVENRVVRVGVDVGCSAVIKPNEFNNRGNAILSAINAIAGHGFSVEIVAVFRANIDDSQMYFSVPIKDAQTAYDADSFAFTIGNVDFGRRLFFACFTKAATLDKELAERFLNGGLGTNTAADMSDVDVVFRYMSAATQHDYATPEKAAATVNALFKNYLERAA